MGWGNGIGACVTQPIYPYPYLKTSRPCVNTSSKKLPCFDLHFASNTSQTTRGLYTSCHLSTLWRTTVNLEGTPPPLFGIFGHLRAAFPLPYQMVEKSWSLDNFYWHKRNNNGLGKGPYTMTYII